MNNRQPVPDSAQSLVLRTQPWVVFMLVALSVATFALSVTVLILALKLAN